MPWFFRAGKLSLVVLVLLTATAKAQPVMVTYRTLEARIAESDHVVVGTVARVQCKVLVAPGARGKDGFLDPNGQFEYTVTLQGSETLKGDVKGVVADLRIIRSVGFDHRYKEWSKSHTRILWFLGVTPKPGEQRDWTILPLGKVVPAEAHFGGRPRPLAFAMDFTRLDDEKAVIARARSYARTSARRLPTHALRVPPIVLFGRPGGNPWNRFIVPVEPALEKLARRLIESPHDFVPRGEKLDAPSRYQLRFEGVTALRHFQSQANITLLRAMLNDAPERIGKSLPAPYPVQTRAYEILLGWDLDAPVPRLVADITRLDLSGTGVTDEGLRRLSGLRNLVELHLQATPVTSRGLQALAKLKKLERLYLDETQLTDANLGALRAIGRVHLLPQVSGINGKQPRSDGDVAVLQLYRAPVTDAGVRHFAGLKNLTALYLNDSRVTGAGLDALAPLDKLTLLHLRHAPVTDAGLRGVVRLEHLTHLALDHTQVTAAGLKELARLERLVELDLSGTPITGDGLKELAPLKRLATLHLSPDQVTDASLRALRAVGMLQTYARAGGADQRRPRTPNEVTWISLVDAPVTDAGLKELAGLRNLISLQLHRTRVTGTGFRELAGLRNLTDLFVKATPLTAAGFRELTHLKRLRTLHMHAADVTDERLRLLREIGMVHVLYGAGARTDYPPGTMPPRATSDEAVQSLNLSWTDVTDAGLKELTGLHNLTSLNLEGTPVTDRGMKELAGLKKLVRLNLSRTRVTDAAVAELRKALPACTLER